MSKDYTDTFEKTLGAMEERLGFAQQLEHVKVTCLQS